MQVNHPHLIGVGMSCEGYGQQVQKELTCNYPNKMYRPSKCKEEICPIIIRAGISCD